MNKPAKLIPLGTRVLHWNGSGHGFGTIVDYNGIPEDSYLRNNFGDAVNLAASAGVNLLGGLVNSMYDGSRYPYVVQWDPKPVKEDDSALTIEMRAKYPRGYKDVYTGSPDDSELTLVDQPNVLSISDTNHVAREWLEGCGVWGVWFAIDKEQYETYRNNKQFQCITR